MRLHGFKFISCYLKHKIFGKSLNIAFYLFVKAFGLHTVQLRQITVEHHLLSPDYKDSVFDVYGL